MSGRVAINMVIAVVAVAVIGFILVQSSSDDPPPNAAPAVADAPLSASTIVSAPLLPTVQPTEQSVGLKALATAPSNNDRPFKDLPEDAPDREGLKARVGQVIAALYGRDALKVTGRENLDCKASSEPTTEEINRINTELRPLDQQLQQQRDSELDNLTAAGIINNAGPDETPVLPVLKSEPMEKEWVTRCNFFKTEGAITASPDLDHWQATARPDRGDGIYRAIVEVPVIIHNEQRTNKLVQQLDTQSLIMRAEWHYKNGNWVMMSYTPH